MTEKHVTSLKAIRANCLGCGGGRPSEVRRCGIDDCPLHPFRMGRNPRRAGVGGRPPDGQETRSESAKAEEAGSGTAHHRLRGS
jgi:hypothetical protein